MRHNGSDAVAKAPNYCHYLAHLIANLRVLKITICITNIAGANRFDSHKMFKLRAEVGRGGGLGNCSKHV